MNKIGKPLIVFIAILLGMCACNLKEKKAALVPPPKLKKVTTLAVTPQTITQKINITGSVIAQKRLELVAKVQGVANTTSPAFKEGVRFKKGQALLLIDDTEFRNNLIAQNSQFVSSLVRIMSDLKIDYPAYFPAWEKYLEGIDIEKQLPTMPKVESKQLKYFLAANNILNSYYSIKSQEQKLADYRINAPYNGVVTQKYFDVGSLIRAGVKVGEFVYTGSYEVLATVSLADLENIQTASKIMFTSSETAQTWEGSLVRTAEKVDESTQSVNIYFTLNDPGLKEGMYLEAELEVNSFSEVVELSKDLITRNNQVFVLKDSLIQLKSIKPIAYTNQTIIVKGLEAGDQLINEVMKPTLQGTKAIAFN